MKPSKGPNWPVMRPGESIAEGDSEVIYDCLEGIRPTSLQTSTNGDALTLNDELFIALKNEVYWQKMSHRAGEVPRLVCAQGDFLEGGAMPIYRHPADEALPLMHWSPLIKHIRDHVQDLVKHPMNHCLIQLYRSGNDYISEHSDKTLDIVRDSSIVNVSLGAQRTMRLRTKRIAVSNGDESPPRRTQLVPLPHGSIFILGQASNAVWLHGINADKRPSFERNEAERAFYGERISLTFRHVGTFIDANQSKIWGQGARSKTREHAHDAINGVEDQTEQLIRAFGLENHSTVFDWDAVYGQGFDILNYNVPTVEGERLLFLSGDKEVDERVKGALERRGVTFRICGVDSIDAGYGYKPEVCLRDTNAGCTEVKGETAITMYLDQI